MTRLVADIFKFFIGSLTISIILIIVFRKWNKVSFKQVIKSNSILYLPYLFLVIIALLTKKFIMSFGPTNYYFDEFLFFSFFVVLFILQSTLVLQYSHGKEKNIWSKRINYLTILLYLIFLIYIIIMYFPNFKIQATTDNS